jgi:hypothetical protein
MVLEDNQKIGIGLICLGLGFVSLGVVLLFDASLIAIGNSLFLAGLCFAIGIRRTITLFTKLVILRSKLIFAFDVIATRRFVHNFSHIYTFMY